MLHIQKQRYSGQNTAPRKKKAVDTETFNTTYLKQKSIFW